MAEGSKIEWTDHTFNPCLTCGSPEVFSSGYCKACYNVEWRKSQDRESTYAFNVVWARWKRDERRMLDRIFAELIAEGA